MKTPAQNFILALLFLALAVPAYAQEDTAEANDSAKAANDTTAVIGLDPEALKKAAAEAGKSADKQADKPVVKKKLDAEDKAQLKRVEDYFNTIRTLKADFTQTLMDGRMAKGTIYLSRPGKMRLEYAPPSQDKMVADGTFVHVWDASAKASSSVPLGTSLADVILRDKFSFGGDIAVTEMRYYPSMMEVTVVQTDNPGAGSLTLEFQDKPLKLRNWRVVDAQGQETRVSLANDEINGKIASSTFYYRDPSFGNTKK